MGNLDGKRVLVVGRGSGIAKAYAGVERVTTETVDLTDDASIETLAGRVGAVDHIVSTASVRARGKIEDLSREAVQRSFDTKAIGPLMLAKAMCGQINAGGSLLLFSGEAAFKIEVGTLAVAITNGAADTLTRSLAADLAPIRVNAI